MPGWRETARTGENVAPFPPRFPNFVVGVRESNRPSFEGFDRITGREDRLVAKSCVFLKTNMQKGMQNILFAL
jgi:hypothetical protein